MPRSDEPSSELIDRASVILRALGLCIPSMETMIDRAFGQLAMQCHALVQTTVNIPAPADLIGRSAGATSAIELLGLSVHASLANQRLASVDEDFAQIVQLLRTLRNRIARAGDAVHAVVERAALSRPRPRKRGKSRKRR